MWRPVNSESGADTGTDMAGYRIKRLPRSSADSALGGASGKPWGLLESSACASVIFTFQLSYPESKSQPFFPPYLLTKPGNVLLKGIFCSPGTSLIKSNFLSLPLAPESHTGGSWVWGRGRGGNRIANSGSLQQTLLLLLVSNRDSAKGWLWEWWAVISSYKHHTWCADLASTQIRQLPLQPDCPP